MKRFLVTMAAICALTSFSFAAEQMVNIKGENGNIVGTLATPDNTDTKKPVILLLHGFTGSRDELPVKDTKFGVFSYTADYLTKNNYPSLRIDFAGSGDSKDMAWEDTTFSSQIADASAALNYISSHADLKDRKIVVLGWSQGGLVASHAVSGRDDIAATILWAPVAEPLRIYANLLGADNVKKALAANDDVKIESTLPWGAKTVLKAKFFKELATSNPVAAIANYNGPLQLVVGSEDTVVTPSPAVGHTYIRYHNGVNEINVLKTDHAFGAFVGPATLDKMHNLLNIFVEKNVK